MDWFEFQPNFAKNNRPHSEVMPVFYQECLRDLRMFLEIKNDNYIYSFGHMTTKQYYTILLENIVTQPRIVNLFPSVNFQEVFYRLHNDFIDKNARDVMFRIIHDIIPVSYYMHNIGIYKDNKCALCHIHVETISHLFYECAFVKPLIAIVKNWLNSITRDKFLRFNISHIRFHTFPLAIFSAEVESLCLYLISLMCFIIWQVRCIVKFEKKTINSNRMILMYINKLIQRIQADFYRFDVNKFHKHWASTNLFCSIHNGKLDLHIGI